MLLHWHIVGKRNNQAPLEAERILSGVVLSLSPPILTLTTTTSSSTSLEVRWERSIRDKKQLWDIGWIRWWDQPFVECIPPTLEKNHYWSYFISCGASLLLWMFVDKVRKWCGAQVNHHRRKYNNRRLAELECRIAPRWGQGQRRCIWMEMNMDWTFLILQWCHHPAVVLIVTPVSKQSYRWTLPHVKVCPAISAYVPYTARD